MILMWNKDILIKIIMAKIEDYYLINCVNKISINIIESTKLYDYKYIIIYVNTEIFYFL